MADSKVEIQVTADAEQAKRTFADVEDAASRAMDAGARSADKLSKSLDGVSKSASGIETNLKGATRALAGMAVGIAASALNRSGEDESAGAAFLKGGLMSGLSAGLMSRNPWIGLAAGAYGLYDTYQQRKTQGVQQGGDEIKAAEGLAKAREQMEYISDRADAFAKILERLGDASADAGSREEWRANEIKARQSEIEEATARMADAEAKLRENGKNIQEQNAPATKEQKEFAERMREVWAEANKALQIAKSELKSIESVKVEKGKPNFDQTGTGNERLGSLLSGLEKAGIGFAALETNAIADKHAKGWGFYEDAGAGMESLVAPAAEAADKTTAAVEDGNDIAEKQLAVLERIESKTTGTAVFA